MDSFEKKLEKAKDVLDSLDSDDITIAELMNKYKEGLKLLNEANEMLEKAKLEIEEIDENSTTTTK